jgi:hypothetical protein
MATTKLAPDATLDKIADYVATATTMLICGGTSSPTDRATALSAALADVAVSSGDFTKANGDASGRKVTVGAKPGVTVDTSGDATCVALIDGTNLLYVTTCTTQTLTAGNTVNVPAWKIEVGDPT